MDQKEYYSSIFDKLENTFSKSDWVLGYGSELIAHGWDPKKLLVTVEPIQNLRKLSANWELEVFLPIFAQKCDYVLAPIDFEIFLSDANYTLYSERHSQLHYFKKYIMPVAKFFEETLQSFGIPYLLDLTPSGGHILFYVKKDTPSYSALESIGWLEPELADAYNFTDPTDLKRNPAAGFRSGSVFSGIGRIWHYICMCVKEKARNLGLPVTICDSEHKCMNMDNSWAAFPGYMRIIRSPFSLHKKNIYKYIQSSEPLCDVIQVEYDGKNEFRCDDYNYLTKCMWDLDMAVEHSKKVTGTIPTDFDRLVPLIRDYYMSSPIYDFDSSFDHTPNLAPQEACHRAVNDHRISSNDQHMIKYPNPRVLQPRILKKFIGNLLEIGWAPKHIGNLITDLYLQPQHNWKENWNKNIASTRANYWARALGSDYLHDNGYLSVK